MAVTNKYAQIRKNGNVVCLVGDESLGMPITDSDVVYTINLDGHAQQNSVKECMIYNPTKGVFEWGDIVCKDEYSPYVKNVNAVLKANAWVGDAAPYTQTLSVPGIGCDTAGFIGVSDSATEEQYLAALDAVLRKTAQDNCLITVTAYEVLPMVDIPIVIKLD